MEILTYRSTPIPGASIIVNHGMSVMKNNLLADEEAVVKVLQRYKESINTADAEAGALLWSMSPDISMIHPRGHEKGWYQIKTNVYGMFRRDFIFRNLKSSAERIALHGDIAVVEFNWDFEALLKTENSGNAVEWGCWDNPAANAAEKNRIVKSRGRESMLLKKIGGEWKIIHIHYSGMPAE
jgi:ketosteroid isomerase-like protein